MGFFWLSFSFLFLLKQVFIFRQTWCPCWFEFPVVALLLCLPKVWRFWKNKIEKKRRILKQTLERVLFRSRMMLLRKRYYKYIAKRMLFYNCTWPKLVEGLLFLCLFSYFLMYFFFIWFKHGITVKGTCVYAWAGHLIISVSFFKVHISTDW